MTRKEKLESVLNFAPPIGMEIATPENPDRFVVLEQDDSGNTLCMYLSNSLDELKEAIAMSETRFVDEVRIHDLDTDTVLVPVWSVQQFAELEDKFSYQDGYATVP